MEPAVVIEKPHDLARRVFESVVARRRQPRFPGQQPSPVVVEIGHKCSHGIGNASLGLIHHPQLSGRRQLFHDVPKQIRQDINPLVGAHNDRDRAHTEAYPSR